MLFLFPTVPKCQVNSKDTRTKKKRSWYRASCLNKTFNSFASLKLQKRQGKIPKKKKSENNVETGTCCAMDWFITNVLDEVFNGCGDTFKQKYGVGSNTMQDIYIYI